MNIMFIVIKGFNHEVTIHGKLKWHCYFIKLIAGTYMLVMVCGCFARFYFITKWFVFSLWQRVNISPLLTKLDKKKLI